MKKNTTDTFKHGIAKPMLCDGFLIPMTDFVNNVGNMENYPSHEKALSWIYNYATFLKQPLKLEMFVPCDEDGNVLEEPKIEEEYVDEHTTQIFAQYQYDLDKAKEKVLFENIPISQAKWLVNSFSTIESLSDISNTITPIYLNNNAIKQIGL